MQISSGQDATVTLIRWVEVPGMKFWSHSVFSDIFDQSFEHTQHLRGWRADRFQNGALAWAFITCY